MARQNLSRRRALTLMSTPLVVAGSGLVTKAEAETYWDVIGHTQIGGVGFSIGLHSSGYPGYYYRTTYPLSYGYHRCNRHCYRHAGYSYHHESCPLLGAHFGYYGAPPPYHYGNYDYGYRRRHYPGRGYGRGYGNWYRGHPYGWRRRHHRERRYNRRQDRRRGRRYRRRY